MIRYFIKRILLLIPVIIVVSFVAYVLVDLAPGTIVDTKITGDMTPEDIEALRAIYDLDKPMLWRYGKYMLNLVQGNLGESQQTGLSVFNMYMQKLPNTLILSACALVIGVLIAIPIGILAARKAGTLTDAATTAFSLAGVSVPSFWLGLLLILLFAMKLGWLPAGGFNDGWKSLILPSFCCAMTLLATSTRQTRSSMLDVLRADFLRTARAKGVPEKTVINKHALGNALIPIITAVGASVCVMLAGSAVVEQVFAWPGVGRMLVDGIFARDVTAILGCVIMTTIMYVLVMLVVDLLYAFVDPRIKSQYVKKKRKKTNTVSTRTRGAQAGADAASAVPMYSQLGGNEQPSYNSNSSDTAYSGAQDYVTRKDENISSGETADDVAAVMTKYKKRSQMGEIWHRLIHNKSALVGIIILGIVVLMALASLFMSYQSVTAANVPARFSPPSLQYPFGTDNMGRNTFLRAIYGSRYSLIIGFGAVIFSAIFGVTLGSTAAYFGGKVDDIIMRISDILASLPAFLLGMVIMVLLGASVQNLIIAVGVAGITHFIRMSRASVLMVKDNEYIEAARAIGYSDLRIILTQVLPNGLSPIIVQATALLGLNITFAAALSFLGFGIAPPTPEWGALISAGREYARTASWLMTYPGLFIMITVLGFNLLGDGLRDALDPKLKK